MKKTISGLLAVVLLLLLAVPARAESLAVDAQACLLMEKTTGQVLYAVNEHQQLEPASVTKIMTVLLVMEAIDSGTLQYDDMVTASAYACSMGGSQIWLKENEQMSVEEMLKAVCVASANDCSVALAEHLAGSADAFVERMNQRAGELGMNDTNFLNPTGLPAQGHVTSAYDIALMSRDLPSPGCPPFYHYLDGHPPGGSFRFEQYQQAHSFLSGGYGAEDRQHRQRPLLPLCHGGARRYGAYRRCVEIAHLHTAF